VGTADAKLLLLYVATDISHQFCSGVTIAPFLVVLTEEFQMSLQRNLTALGLGLNTRVGTLIVATIYLQLIQNRYMFRSFTVLQCSHQHCV